MARMKTTYYILILRNGSKFEKKTKAEIEQEGKCELADGRRDDHRAAGILTAWFEGRNMGYAYPVE